MYACPQFKSSENKYLFVSLFFFVWNSIDLGFSVQFFREMSVLSTRSTHIIYICFDLHSNSFQNNEIHLFKWLKRVDEAEETERIRLFSPCTHFVSGLHGFRRRVYNVRGQPVQFAFACHFYEMRTHTTHKRIVCCFIIICS